MILALGALALSAPTAQAADSDYGLADLSSQQQDAIAAWDATASNVTVDHVAKGPSVMAAAAGGVKTLKLYRGSWVLWAEENVQFGYSGDGRTVTWSSAWQNSGWVIPNHVTEKGTSRYYATSTQHSWRGGYTIGAGVPTPWGNANVYSASSTAESRIKNIGSTQWWSN